MAGRRDPRPADLTPGPVRTAERRRPIPARQSRYGLRHTEHGRGSSTGLVVGSCRFTAQGSALACVFAGPDRTRRRLCVRQAVPDLLCRCRADVGSSLRGTGGTGAGSLRLRACGHLERDVSA
jgi:hypothetical protein